jgi:hypothetical protein
VRIKRKQKGQEQNLGTPNFKKLEEKPGKKKNKAQLVRWAVGKSRKLSVPGAK